MSTRNMPIYKISRSYRVGIFLTLYRPSPLSTDGWSYQTASQSTKSIASSPLNHSSNAKCKITWSSSNGANDSGTSISPAANTMPLRGGKAPALLRPQQRQLQLPLHLHAHPVPEPRPEEGPHRPRLQHRHEALGGSPPEEEGARRPRR